MKCCYKKYYTAHSVWDEVQYWVKSTSVISSCIMHEQKLKDGLVKILKICCRNGFYNLQTTKSSLISIQYGPLGSLFTKNVWREWLSSIINNVDVCMLPIEIIKSKNEIKLKQHSVKVSPFFSDALKNYFRCLSLFGKGNPYGFAVYGPLIGLEQNDVLLDIPVLRKFEYRYGLCIAFFCPTKKSSDWFNYWSRYRYRWWRKFSSIPSKFSMSDVTEIQEGNQQISIMMEFSWGKENLETITLYDENVIQTCCQVLGLKYLNNQTSAVIVCESELNLAAFAYLSNSFSQKWRNGEIRKLFQLHTKLAPYKASISINNDCPNDMKRLKNIATHLEKDLKKNRVPVYPYYDDLNKDCVQDFNRLDEMAVPYTIVLNKKALNSGIIGLRNRDTTLEEQVHVTELTSKLLKYLQMKSFDAEGS